MDEIRDGPELDFLVSTAEKEMLGMSQRILIR